MSIYYARGRRYDYWEGNTRLFREKLDAKERKWADLEVYSMTKIRSYKEVYLVEYVDGIDPILNYIDGICYVTPNIKTSRYIGYVGKGMNENLAIENLMKQILDSIIPEQDMANKK